MDTKRINCPLTIRMYNVFDNRGQGVSMSIAENGLSAEGDFVRILFNAGAP